MKKILIFNTGSTSIKFKLYGVFETQRLREINNGEISGIGTFAGPKNHRLALTLLFEGFGFRRGVLEKIENLALIAHRVVHGGGRLTQPMLVTKDIIKELKKYNDLAPLHNPPILEVMQAIFQESQSKNHRTIPNYAVFDTGFFVDLPKKASLYPLSWELGEKYGIKRFGFHGLSHKNAYEQAQRKYGEIKRMISVHLGAGCSVTAIKDGKAVDTSMGFTPEEGLMMGTRSGDLDPGIIFYLINQKRFHSRKLYQMMTQQSGLLGVSGASSEMLDILYLAGYKVEDENYRPRPEITSLPQKYKNRAYFALEMFVYRIQKYIGAYQAILGGVDILAFTGKIGAGSSVIRQLILRDLKHLLKNTKILAIPTDEEYQIVKEVLPFLS